MAAELLRVEVAQLESRSKNGLIAPQEPDLKARLEEKQLRSCRDRTQLTMAGTPIREVVSRTGHWPPATGHRPSVNATNPAFKSRWIDS
ncbi:hypothetical protein AB0E78_23795 [Streptomyces sp. NPDC032198]|uniref:hypothetical protein n=1 Tax=Streptomyces sp. NPDC032198 TaxID=3155127 RepID=UPI003410BAE0